jgi:hypothetical protein
VTIQAFLDDENLDAETTLSYPPNTNAITYWLAAGVHGRG